THHLLQNTYRSLYRFHILDYHTTLAVLLTQIAVTRILAHVINHLAKSRTLIIRTFLITDKEQSHSSGFQEYFFHPQPFSQSAQRYDTQKFQPFGRNLSETVLQPCLESEQVLIQFQSVQFTIKQHTFAAAGDILIREKQFQITFHLTFIHKV